MASQAIHRIKTTGICIYGLCAPTSSTATLRCCSLPPSGAQTSAVREKVADYLLAQKDVKIYFWSRWSLRRMTQASAFTPQPLADKWSAVLERGAEQVTSGLPLRLPEKAMIFAALISPQGGDPEPPFPYCDVKYHVFPDLPAVYHGVYTR